MMQKTEMHELVFEAVEPAEGDGRIDGPCRLPATLPWPVGGDSHPLFHLLSIPLVWLVPDVPPNRLAERWVSVFIAYDASGYSHYAAMSSDEPDHADAVVVLHDGSGPERSMHPRQGLTSRQVRREPRSAGDDDVASYIGSTPVWVQDPIFVEGFRWVMSLYGPDMDVALGGNRGILSDGVGYVFLKNASVREAGDGAEFDANAFNQESFGPIGTFYLQL